MVMDKKVDSVSVVSSTFLFFVFLIFTYLSTFHQVVDASCVFIDGQIGECVTFEECRSAVALYRRGVNPVFCNLQDGTVCCKDFKRPKDSIQNERRPLSEVQSSNSEKWQSGASSHVRKDPYEGDYNYQRKKHSALQEEGDNGNINNYGKKKSIHNNYEEPYKFEIPSNVFSESETDNKPVRRPGRPNKPAYNDQSEEEYFVPPGLAKKKPWREEKTTENDYYFEYATKKSTWNPTRKGSKPSGNNYDSPKLTDERSTRRNDWYDGGDKRTTDSYDWVNSQNEFENSQSNQRTTTKRNKWVQETYTTTGRNEYFEGRPGNNYGENEDEYYNVKPNRRPHRPSTSTNFQGSKPENNRPEFQQGSRPTNNRPGFQQGSRPQGNNPPGLQQGSRPQNNRPGFQQGSRPQGNHPPGSQQGSRPQNNRPGFQQGARPHENNPPGLQQGSRPQNNRPGFQQGSRPQNNRPGFQEGSKPQQNIFPGSQQGSSVENNRPNSRPGQQQWRRVSEQKCEEYSKQVTENITGLPLTTDPDPVTIPIRKCIQPQQLIVGGENTTLGEFPHMAAVGFRDRNKNQISWNCGGTLISEQFVLTAAHCTSTSSGRPVKVRLGEYNLMKNDDGAYPVDYAIVEIITHPEYKPPSKYNDIALLKLSRKVTFFKHIRPACLYVEETFSASKAIATGWGRMYHDGNTSEILQKVVLSVVDNNTCNRLYKANVKSDVLSRGIVGSQLCAGELTGGKDTCQGDSGGPLSITNTKCIHHIIGVTSFGKSCALPNSTGVYTRVSAYVPWIESVVWPTD